MKRMKGSTVRQKIRDGKKQLRKARAKADREGHVILAGILGELRNNDPDWKLELTDQDNVIVFSNNRDRISLDLSNGEIIHDHPLSPKGTEGLKLLHEEVESKKDKWLAVRREFEEALSESLKIIKSMEAQIDQKI